MKVSVPGEKKTKEVREFMQLCESTLQEHPTENILEFIRDKKHGRSAKMLQWAVITTFAFLLNQVQDKWIYEEPTEEEAEVALTILAKLVKDLEEFS